MPHSLRASEELLSSHGRQSMMDPHFTCSSPMPIRVWGHRDTAVTTNTRNHLKQPRGGTRISSQNRTSKSDAFFGVFGRFRTRFLAFFWRFWRFLAFFGVFLAFFWRFLAFFGVQRRFPILARYPCTHAVPVTTRLFPLGMCVISGCIECWPGGQGAD